MTLVCALALASAAGSATVIPGFRSPSGNIQCLVLPGKPAFLYCSLLHADYAKKLIAYCAQPRIGVDWAGFTLGQRTKGSVECSGGAMVDTTSEHLQVVTLAYGKTWRRGVFTCVSRTTGVTCRNPRGHGLFLSRQSYRLF